MAAIVPRVLNPTTKPKEPGVGQEKVGIAGLPAELSMLKKQIQASRVASIKEKLAHNGSKLQSNTSQLSELTRSRGDLCSTNQMENKNILSFRTVNFLCKINGSDSGFVEKDNVNSQEELPSLVILFRSNSNGRCSVRPTKLPFVEKIPPYTTWIFLARNQRMADDQSVVGRRQIYYDEHGGETVICSDSETELAEQEEPKHDFSEGEDQMLWNVLQQYGSDSEVVNALCQFIDASPSEIQERYETLFMNYQDNQAKETGSSEETDSESRLFLDRSLSAALDSFDNLFCRLCLTFDCRLHGCSQNIIIPSEKQQLHVEVEDVGKPCSDHCFLLKSTIQGSCNLRPKSGSISEMDHLTSKDRVVTPYSEAENPNLEVGQVQHEVSDEKCVDDDRDITLTSDVSLGFSLDTNVATLLPCHAGKRSVAKHEHLLMGGSSSDVDLSTGYVHKKQKKLTSVAVSMDDENQMDVDLVPLNTMMFPNYGQHEDDLTLGSDETHTKMDIVSSGLRLNDCSNNSVQDEAIGLVVVPTVAISDGFDKEQISQAWNIFEKDLFIKGLEIFGKNSCLIARNLLSGLKTCKEVYDYMFNDGVTALNRPMLANSGSEYNFVDPDCMEQEMPTRSRIWRRRGRARKLKYTWKSAGHPSIRKRIADGKEQCKRYVPCGCQQMCGKECSCLLNGTCCEKYCGCSKSCKNRFRGCHCAKSQCRSRQCPCFAAGRECDPDVCRNCWVSCGDGSLGEPPARADGYQCGNMKLLLKQQQRILLGRSDVAGWGAFIKNPVNKHDYLGEYTGELISHKEADKRGKIYDRANSSFLFDLNDQYVLDAYRKGDKLKFANHSSNPNCYAKVMLVAGDHRVGIFANEHIEAGEELFYDYRYGPDQAPAWARKPEDQKKDDYSSHSRRAHKVA